MALKIIRLTPLFLLFIILSSLISTSLECEIKERNKPLCNKNFQLKQADSPGAFTLTTDAGTPDLDGTFNLNWTDSAGADNYTICEYSYPIIEINESINFIEEGIITPNKSISTYSGIHYYAILAYNTTGNTTSNNVPVEVHVPPLVFNMTSDAGIPFDNDGTFTLSWNQSLGANIYSIYQYNYPITKVNESLVSVENETTLFSHYIPKLYNGVYYFIVVAFNDYGNITSNCIAIEVKLQLLIDGVDDDDDDSEELMVEIPGYNIPFTLISISIIILLIFRKLDKKLESRV